MITELSSRNMLMSQFNVDTLFLYMAPDKVRFFSYFSTKTYVVFSFEVPRRGPSNEYHNIWSCTHLKCLAEALQMSTHNICSCGEKKYCMNTPQHKFSYSFEAPCGGT